MPSATATLIASLVVTAVGAGVSAYGQHQQGKMQDAIAQFNARKQEQQSQTQLLSMQTQAALQKQQADANFQLRLAESKSHDNNAQAIESQALAQDAINRQNLIKRREDFAKMQGQQRAQIAASGVAESSGTPLDLLAETAARIQQDQEEQHFAGEVQRRTLFSEAAQERLGGKLALVGATLNRDSSVAEASLRASAGQAEYLAGMRQAEITRLTGAADRQSANYRAAGTLFSSAASGMSTSATFYKS